MKRLNNGVSSDKANINAQNKPGADISKYEEFLQSHPKGHFMQSPQWAEVKSFWKNEIVTVEDENGNIKGAMSLLIRKIPILPYTMMYSPRGPVCDPHDESTLRELLEKCKALAKKHRSYVLKMDPDIEVEDTQFEEIVKKLGFRVSRGLKNYEGIQPRFVFRLDLRDKTEEQIMADFHHKVRYNIRLAGRKGVEVRVGTREDVAVFHRMIVETGIRDNFVVRSREYYEKVFDCLSPDHLRVFIASYEGKPIAGTIAILYGNKCWYLYGASINEHRNLMPNYLLQWNMIKWALESGCDMYDFRGVPGDLDENNPMYGLYRFKVGFRGKFTEFVGMLDYVFNPFVNFIADKGITAFRELRRKIYKRK
ncbi:MAG TPA: peptidoglycan bridge formation glycyltransferase FemA/FemB family protein [Clostridiales bacterium]|nr:peptidoglycan bridge formation glycyltransferase FemA/FemB family protein [Clostridiales bacterium]HQD31368.1 peptidoglycan bridge formation glycyltransferase FemA/FemB family protein [Clostridiales bacterium]